MIETQEERLVQVKDTYRSRVPNINSEILFESLGVMKGNLFPPT